MTEKAQMKTILVAGTRPDFIKVAPLMSALKQYPSIEPKLMHTGEHSDWRMSGLLFRQLGLPEPEINLDVDAGNSAAQMAAVTRRFESVILEQRPACILVIGNVHNAIACVLAAAKRRIRVVHVEAGLRTPGRLTQLEITRSLTDHVSDLLFCTEQSAVDNLRRERVPEPKIHFVGNVMADTLFRYKAKMEASKILAALEIQQHNYAVATLHRWSNINNPATLSSVISVLRRIGRILPIIFPIHPATRSRMPRFEVEKFAGIRFIDPLGYIDFVKLISCAKVVLTDSGGVQEETTLLDVPCLTLKENTERPCTVEIGSNLVVGTDPDRIMEAFGNAQNGGRKTARIPPLWDGRAAERIAKVIESIN
jgi:UDP-N-acetylglucosamine 2-epimerase (non-hydrolysing)